MQCYSFSSLYEAYSEHNASYFRPQLQFHNPSKHLCDHGACSGALVSPRRWEDSNCLVVARESVNSRLNENKSELGVFVFSISLQVLADSDSLDCEELAEANKMI